MKLTVMNIYKLIFTTFLNFNMPNLQFKVEVLTPILVLSVGLPILMFT